MDPKTPRPVYFDIETGGFWPTAQQSINRQKLEGVTNPSARPSSILSISYAEGAQHTTTYSQPAPGSWVSRFSEQNILPQLEGKQTVSEADSIRQFIGSLRANPGAPIAGYNIAGFDMEFLQGRARQHGMGDEFRRLAEGRAKIDVGFEVRDLIAGAVNQQVSDGVFAPHLGGRTFASLELDYFGAGGRRPGVAPTVPRAQQDPNFKILSQVRGFVRGGFRGRVEGWKLAPTFDMYSKWAGTGSDLVSLAHESEADVKMTQILHEAVESGKFSQFVNRPEFGPSWLQMVHEQRAAGAVTPKGAGSFWRGAAKAASSPPPAAPVVASRSARWALPTGRELKVLGGVGAALLGASALYSAFSGFDDSYNTLEGMNHGGMAEQGRKLKTDFGSGYTGLPVDSDILSFREEVLLDKERKAELKAELKQRELEAQEEVGSFVDQDYMGGDAVLAGINAKRQDLQMVNLNRFNIEIEDADSLILSHRGLFSSMFKQDILIRLAGIDAPEVGGHGVDPLEDIRWRQEQAGGEEAAQELRQRIAQASSLSLVVASEGKTYGRYLGAVVADGQNVNIELARSGAVSALPFGKVEEELVDRSAIGRAERQAQAADAGIQNMARYKAIAIATEAAGRDITYNTLTRLDKLGEDLNMGAYATLLETMGDDRRELSVAEASDAALVGRSLRNRFSYGSRFTGRDDGFNSIEGLGHAGIASEVRQMMTEFGSGWTGLLSIPKSLQRYSRKSSLGAQGLHVPDVQFKNVIKTFSDVIEKEEASFLGRFFGKGRRARAREGLETLERGFAAVPLEADGTYVKKAYSGAVLIDPSQVNSISELKGIIKHERVHGANLAAIRQNPSVLDELEVPDTFRKQLTGQETVIDRLNTKIGDWAHQNLGIGVPSRQQLYGDISERSLKDEYLAYGLQNARIGAPNQNDPMYAAAREFADRTNLMKRRPPVRTKVPGNDDSHNTIEGLHHGGWAQKLRRFFTPFSSGWDALRNFTKVGESFSDMLKSKGFQESLQSAQQVKRIGEESKFASAFLMKGSFRGKEFSFVRKYGVVGKEEASSMARFSDDFSPSLYRTGFQKDQNFIDMELFEGNTAREKLIGGEFSKKHMDELYRTVDEMHEAGIAHGDLHPGNLFITKDDKVGIIDFGKAGKVGDQVTLMGGPEDLKGILAEMYAENNFTLEEGKIMANKSIRMTAPGRTEFTLGTSISKMEDVQSVSKIAKSISVAQGTPLISGTPAISPSGNGAFRLSSSVFEDSSDLFGDSSDLFGGSVMKTSKSAHAAKTRAAISTVTQAGKIGGKKSRM